MMKRAANQIRAAGLVLALSIGAAAAAAESLEIYLPREVKVEPEVIELGAVGVLRGPETLCRKAREVTLGQFALPGQTIQVDRVTILSRLAAAGISASDVSLSGARILSVSRTGQRLTGEQLAQTAQAFIEAQYKEQGLVSARPMQVPSDPLRGIGDNFEVVPSLGDHQTPGRRFVVLSLRENGREVQRLTVPVQVRFRVQQPVTVHAIPSGSVIDAAAVRLEEIEALEPQSGTAAIPSGMVAQRDIPAGAAIQPQWLREQTPPVLIGRRQKVILRLERGGLQITASGEAMDEGRAGDVVRVKRGSRPNERIVIGTVKPDGSVEPIL